MNIILLDKIANLGGLGDALMGKKVFAPPCVMGGEEIMSQKAHGTSATPVQQNLRWSCSEKIADQICNFKCAAALE